jgi:hydroxypyruvate reductase
MSSIDVLVTWPLDNWLIAEAEQDFCLHRLWRNPDLSQNGPSVRGVITSAIAGCSDELLEQLPNLEVIVSFGVGVDRIDLTRTRERGIVVTNTPGVLEDCVADMALGLLLAVSRRIPAAERFVRAGHWQHGKMSPGVRASGKRCGVVGMGQIGRAIARRLEGFAMDVAYTGPHPKPDLPYRYLPELVQLADWSDFLILALPGGAATHHTVSRRVLEALGPAGALINVARGSVVDQQALVELIVSGQLGGAGLDVLEEEPQVPQELLGRDNVVITPHCASYTHETRRAMAELTLANLRAHFARQPVPTPVQC